MVVYIKEQFCKKVKTYMEQLEFMKKFLAKHIIIFLRDNILMEWNKDMDELYMKMAFIIKENSKMIN